MRDLGDPEANPPPEADEDAFLDPTDGLGDGFAFAHYACEGNAAVTPWCFCDPTVGNWHQEDPIGFPAAEANVRRYAGEPSDELPRPE